MEMDSVIAAANPAARSTVCEPPPAITPRMMPRMLTSPSWPPRMTSRSQFVLRWCSRRRDEVATAAASVARTVRPNRVSAPSRRSGSAFIAHLLFLVGRSWTRALSGDIDPVLPEQGIEAGLVERGVDPLREHDLSLRGGELRDDLRSLGTGHGVLAPVLELEVARQMGVVRVDDQPILLRSCHFH